MFWSINNYLSAFTLAEVLVTLGVIGIVSAITIPTLVQNYQKKVYVTQLHKITNEIQQAFLKEINDNNAINLKEAGFNTKNFLNKHFKVLELCRKEACLSVDYKNINGQTIMTGKFGWLNGYCAVIASGAEICIDNLGRTHTYNGYSSTYGITFIDVNGAKGPNIIGRDGFFMINWDDGILDTLNVSPACRTKGICDGESLETIREAGDSGRTCEATRGWGDQACFGKILNNNWEMNY